MVGARAKSTVITRRSISTVFPRFTLSYFMSCSGSRNIQNCTHTLPRLYTYTIIYTRILIYINICTRLCTNIIYVHLRAIIMNPRAFPSCSARTARPLVRRTALAEPAAAPSRNIIRLSFSESYARLFVIVIAGDFET